MDATRRSLFGAALALSAAPISVLAPRDSAAALFEECQAALAAFRASDNAETEDEELDRLTELQNAALDAPIRSSIDAAAKVKLAAASLESGNLTNGKDAEALKQVARWLEAN